MVSAVYWKDSLRLAEQVLSTRIMTGRRRRRRRFFEVCPSAIARLNATV